MTEETHDTDYNNTLVVDEELEIGGYALLSGILTWGFCILLYSMKIPVIDKLRVYNRKRKLNKYIIADEDVYGGICPICIDEYGNDIIVKLNCNHVYHKSCLEMWIINHEHKDCPYCRAIINL
tara:strand:- start:436 stop:804 length:369 start_codon:yes stop_codon:yes gene_type:complete